MIFCFENGLIGGYLCTDSLKGVKHLSARAHIHYDTWVPGFVMQQVITSHHRFISLSCHTRCIPAYSTRPQGVSRVQAEQRYLGGLMAL